MSRVSCYAARIAPGVMGTNGPEGEVRDTETVRFESHDQGGLGLDENPDEEQMDWDVDNNDDPSDLDGMVIEPHADLASGGDSGAGSLANNGANAPRYAAYEVPVTRSPLVGGQSWAGT